MLRKSEPWPRYLARPLRQADGRATSGLSQRPRYASWAWPFFRENHTGCWRNAEGGKRKGLVFTVFLCTCCVPFPALLFVDVFPAIVPSFGVATCVTTYPYLLCMVALVATSSRCCVATWSNDLFKVITKSLLKSAICLWQLFSVSGLCIRFSFYCFLCFVRMDYHVDRGLHRSE